MYNVLLGVILEDITELQLFITVENLIPVLLSLFDCVMSRPYEEFCLISSYSTIYVLPPVNLFTKINTQTVRIVNVLSRVRVGAKDVTTEMAFRLDQLLWVELFLEAPVDSLFHDTGISKHFMHPSQCLMHRANFVLKPNFSLDFQELDVEC